MIAQAWPFVHPAIAAAAVGAAAIPVVIHLIHRRRFRRVPWAAMTFLLAATKRSAKRLRLEHFLLMMARIALVVLFGMAVARPFVPRADWTPWPSARVHRVILLDNSLSMNAKRSDGRTRFTVAREAASNLLKAFPATDPLSLITLASPAETRIGSPSYDRRLARELLASVKATQQRSDIAGGLATALDLLEDQASAGPNRAVYLISDFAETEWLTARNANDPGEPRAEGAYTEGEVTAAGASDAARALSRLAETLEDPATDLHLVRTDDQPRTNVALTDLAVDSHLVARDLPLQIRATVTNFGETPVRDAWIEFRRHAPGTGDIRRALSDGETRPESPFARSVQRVPLPHLLPGEPTGAAGLRRASPAGAATSMLFTEPGTHVVEARLVLQGPDALPLDNVRWLSVEVRESTRVLLVDGRPGPSPLDGNAGFLATALSPGAMIEPIDHRDTAPADPSLIATKTITAVELAGEPLPAYDVVALCGVPRLSSAEWDQLEQYVTEGGGLLIIPGEQLQVEHYNRYGLRGQNDTAIGLLPGLLGAPIDAPAEPTTGATRQADVDGDFASRSLRFGAGNLNHPIVEEFRDRSASGLFSARVTRYVPISVDRSRSEVVLHYTNGDPAIVASGLGGGRVVLFTTTANLDWTNLPAKGDFVSLMLNTVSYLTSGKSMQRNLLVGQSVREELSAVETGLDLRVVAPDGSSLDPRLCPAGRPAARTATPADGVRAATGGPTGPGLALCTEPAQEAGVLTLLIGSEPRRFAINTDPVESDLAVASKEHLSDALAHGVHWVDAERVMDAGVGSAHAAELGGFVLYAALLILLVELWLAMHFASPPATRSAGARRFASPQAGNARLQPAPPGGGA